MSSYLENALAASAGSPTRATLRIDVLGPVEVSFGGVGVPLTPLELNLLVLLALTPGVAVSADRLIDQLWGDRLPAAPRCRLQGLVSGLRRKIGDTVETRYPGYLVDRSRLARDVDEYERLVAEAQVCDVPVERLRLLVEAQDVWRGEPLVGVSTPGVVPERTRLVEQRMGLLEARGEAELALGRHREVTSLLAPAVEEYPFRERLAGLYMTALYRCNRQADALNAYHRLRERLADELGSDVCAELRELYVRILRGDPMATDADPVAGERETAPAPSRPAQLPAPDGLFVGREAERRALAAAAGPAVVVVSGAGGLGKTSLVVAWAHEAAADFADGQLFLDLGAQDRSPEEVVGTALVSLGVPAAEVPVGLAERIGRYRTLVRDRALLVVADDARSVEQVLALVPPGPASRLVVTSRRRLVSLAAHHSVREVVLAPVDDSVTARLLQTVVGSERMRSPAAAALVEWCGGWPLLARHAGASLAARPSQSVTAFVGEIERGADPSPAGDARSVESALASVHESLSPPAARLFERLALHSGVICLHLAAVAASTTAARARRLLDELTDANLLVETGSGEFRLHTVVARFGRRLACEAEWTAPVWDTGGDEVRSGCLECGAGLVSTVESPPVRERVPA